MFQLTTLLVQIGVILVVARIVGLIFRKIHQPQVIGEMVAGILLGPSLLGWLAPGVSAALFPPQSLGFLNALSQIGLVVFMFLVGLELNPQNLRGRTRAAVVTSNVGILVPFILGTLLALFLYPQRAVHPLCAVHRDSHEHHRLPVLARILTERDLLRTHVGAVTITCAAVDDVTAWCILAGVVLLVRAGAVALPFWATLLGLAVYLTVMLFGVRPVLRKLEGRFQGRNVITQDGLALILLLALASAWVTERLGLHAFFGAFLMGAIMPKDQGFVQAISEKLEYVTVILLLPLFFAFTGLRTSIGLLSGGDMWLYAGLIILVAIAGKFGGSTIASRLTGLSWREAGTLGVLMNTRGLVELVALNIGYDIGVISPALFTMLVLMALVTTFMTSPFLEWIYPARLRQEEQYAEAARAGHISDASISRPAQPGELKAAKEGELVTGATRASRPGLIPSGDSVK